MKQSQQSQTILNYLNGNFLISTQQENQLITIEYDVETYYQCFNLLNYQIFNHQNSSRPLLIINLESKFEGKKFNIEQLYSQFQCQKYENFIKFSNNVYCIFNNESLNAVLDQIEKDNVKSIEILFKGIEISQNSFLEQLKFIQQKAFKSQITLLIPKHFENKELKTIYILSNCRIIVNQLIANSNSNNEFNTYSIIITMVHKKYNGHSFLKQYLIDGMELRKKKLKILKIKKEVQITNENEITKKIGASFTLQLSEEQKQLKAEIDHQINPYKYLINSQNAPLIYDKEGDEKRVIIDDEQEDIEEIEEYEG